MTVDHTTDSPSLGADFPEADRAAWRALVESALKGADFEKALTTPLAEGLRIQPIYGADDGAFDTDAITRHADAADRVRFGWDVRQRHGHPDPEATNTAILTDLERGVTSIELALDRSVRLADMPSAEYADGVLAHTVDQLDTALNGVFLDAAVVTLRPGAAFEQASALLAALWRRRGISESDAHGHFGADPLGALAAEGKLHEPVDAAVARAARLAAHTHATYPNATSLSVDSTPYHDAGADEAMDLAYAMATGVAYLRAMETEGLAPTDAARQIQFTLPTGVDVFLGIAKLRAARMLWARILEASGVAEEARSMRLHTTTAARNLSQRDAWVNMLRVTVATFAAATGGADSITVPPYTDALGLPDGFARRAARNTQLLLLEESHLARVIDPAGGSWYVERLTQDLAQIAWEKFQEIEHAGGLAQALISGKVVEDCAAAWSTKERQIAKRRIELTGINTFPKVDEVPADVVQPDLAALAETARTGIGARVSILPDADFQTRVVAAFDGASVADLTPKGAGFSIQPLAAHRLGEAFEALRDACDAATTRPTATLIEIGRPADFTARATFARNYLGAGGIGVEDLEIGAADDLGAVTGLAVICSSDNLYDDQAEAVARALKTGGATRVVLAGRPGEREQALRDAGVDGFIFAGDDTLATLRGMLTEMGVLS
ncbi:MAG: methylmalonyl-CoA mutase subunit beta [Alphaproteobacteria bacterium]|nr:methylmalonyl-CoA mutase subunit beta [Alphaproteobacteria bacterium]